MHETLGLMAKLVQHQFQNHTKALKTNSDEKLNESAGTTVNLNPNTSTNGTSSSIESQPLVSQPAPAIESISTSAANATTIPNTN